MSATYPPRFIALCSCGWHNAAWDRHFVVRSAEVHGELKPGHVAKVYRLAEVDS